LKHVQGLSGVETTYLPPEIPVVFLSTIRTLYSVGAGEFSLGLTRWSSQLGEK
jgi:hypothetical protein